MKPLEALDWVRIILGLSVLYKSSQVFQYKAVSYFWTDKKFQHPKLFAVLMVCLGVYLLWPLIERFSPRKISNAIKKSGHNKKIAELISVRRQKKTEPRPPTKNYRYTNSQKVTPLDLDLKSLSGGGRSPSQYYGETHDGLKVYCRYRYGTMEVRLSSVLENDYYKMESLMYSDVGSQYDGFISITQFCEVAGITVNGKIPEGNHTSEELAVEHDLKGTTTFYEFYKDCTLETQSDILEEIFSWDDTTVIERGLDDEPGEGIVVCSSSKDLTQNYIKVIIGPEPSPVELEQLDKSIVSTSRHTVINLNLSRREYVIRGYGPHELAEEVSSKIGRQLTVAGHAKEGEASESSYGRLSMKSSFKSDNEKADADIARIDKLYERYFPKCKRIWIDLLTDKVHLEELYSADKRLLEWTDPDTDKWLHIQLSGPPPDGVPTGAYLEFCS